MTHVQTDSVSPDVRIRNAEAAVARYGAPSTQLRVIGVTGTNGKTTTVNILRALFDHDAARGAAARGVAARDATARDATARDATAHCASIGTLGVLLGSAGEVIPGGMGLTTPGPDELQRVLRELVDRGVSTAVMEVSSHALDQRRVHGVTFDAAVFTNLTRDHLDYHQTMETYFAAKARLVEYLKPNGVAVVNADEHAWDALPASPRRVTFGLHAGDVRAIDVRYTPRGSAWTLAYAGETAEARLPLIGDFNVANALGAAATALALGRTLGDVAERLAAVPQVPGRLEVLSESPTVLRDYAHTPDALDRALRAVRPFTRGRVIVVFGAGGDRDPGKRPLMGAIAEEEADVAIVTSDNPRTESPSAIIDAIEAGMRAGRHLRIEDRRKAIAKAIELAAADDVVLLAGKGHETYQIVGTEKYPFDEKVIVGELLAAAR